MTKLIPKFQRGKKVNWNQIKRDPEYKKFDWKMNTDNLSIIQDSLLNRKIDPVEQIAVFSQAVPENGGDIGPHGNGAFGILGWRGTRAQNLPTTLDGQIHKMLEETYNNPKAKDWTHGGKGTGIQTGKEMYEFFKTTPVTRKAVNAFMRGYVRPPQSEYQKRQDFAKFLEKYFL